jgi:hypothetical protein
VFAGGDRDKTERDNVTTELHLAGKLPEKLAVWEGSGSHGGADPIMLGYLFDPKNMPADRYGRASDQVSGAWSILTGIAANASIARDGERICIDDMLSQAGIVL